MDNAHSSQSRRAGHSSLGPIRGAFVEATRFWEPRRLVYNTLLVVATLGWFVVTWPHFRPALTLPSLLAFTVLALLANVCYSAAYLLDIPLQHSSLSALWKRRRWIVWWVGTAFAILLANYWITDEIYPFVR